jgi:hypothetical protein
VIAELTDEQVAAPSSLPGWTVGTSWLISGTPPPTNHPTAVAPLPELGPWPAYPSRRQDLPV